MSSCGARGCWSLANERAIGRASDPVLSSQFLIFLNHYVNSRSKTARGPEIFFRRMNDGWGATDDGFLCPSLDVVGDRPSVNIAFYGAIFTMRGETVSEQVGDVVE